MTDHGRDRRFDAAFGPAGDAESTESIRPTGSAEPGRPPGPAESDRSAFDDELADSFALDEVERRPRQPRHAAAGEPAAAPTDGEPTDGKPADGGVAQGGPPSPSPDPVAPPGASVEDATASSGPSSSDAVPWPRRRTEQDVTEQNVTGQASADPAEPNPMVTSDRPPGEVDRKTVRRRRKLRRYRSPWWELPALVLLAIAIAVLVKSFVVQPFYIPSQSMEKTLHGCPGCSGDRILVNKLIYDFRDPHPGDIVVFNAPEDWDEVPALQPPSNPVLRVVRGFGQLVGFVPPDGMVLVKRVIATGGQTVRGENGKVQISEHGTSGPWRTLDEPYVFRDGSDPRATFGPVTVPKNRLWVMGDHRNDSADSRYHCDAAGSGNAGGSTCDPMTSTVSVDEVIGKAFVIAWPPSRWRTLGTPATFEHAAMAGSALGVVPVGGAAALVVPLYLVRRRRRRRTRYVHQRVRQGG